MSLFSNLSTLFGSNSRKPRTSPPKAKRFGKPVAKNNQQQTTSQTQQVPARGQRPADHQSASQPQAPARIPDNFQANLDKLEREAQAKAREIVVEAKAEALTIRGKAENESREISRQLDQQQRSLEDKLDKLDQKLNTLSQKEDQLEKEQQVSNQQRDDLVKKRQEVLKELEKVSGLTMDEAKATLFETLEQKLTKEMALLVRQKEEEAKAEAEEKVKEILIDSMKHGATDYVPEYTVSVVNLPSEETKGKIIGKAGRNINAFEHRTGVDVDLDMSPTEVRLSCFDPVRREVARISLERLIKDGRIQPSRIEEVVSKVESELSKVMLEAGKNLCHEVGIYNLPVDLMSMLGKFKYRFSYGQNLISHTLEETKIGMKLASELKVDVNIVKLGCLLHDIGKVSDEAEGSHVELGVKIAKRFNLPQPVIDCIAQHHEDEPFTGPEQMVVYIADAISGARPGARYENYDAYVKRLQQLEEIATNYDQVRQAYAIQAGREVRVLLDPESSKDDDVTILSTKIRDQIKDNMTYPGTVTVTVIRETRGQSVAT
jgi:ribonucrease Y